MDDQFKILLQAAIDKVASKKSVDADIVDLQTQIDKIKIKAELDQNTASKLANDIARLVNQQITISNININRRQLGQSAQQAADVISDVTKRTLDEVSSKHINVAFEVTEQASIDFQRAVDKEIAKIQGNKNTVVSVKMTTNTEQIPVLDSFGEATGDYEHVEKLTGAVFKYNTELGETITKTMKWAQIGTTIDDDGNDAPLMGWVQGLTTYNRAIEEATVKTNTFVDKQKQAVANLSNTLSQISSNALDKNAPKAIKDDGRRNQIETQVLRVRNALSTLAGANESAFTDAKIAVDNEISSLKILIKALQNAESTATSFRAKPIDVIRDETLQKIKGLEADIKKAGVSSKDLSGYLADANNALSNTNIDTSSINDALNSYERARAELGKLRKEASAQISLERAQIKADGLRSEINNLISANAELSKYEATIDKAKVTTTSLLAELNNVKTAGDVSLIGEKWKSFVTSAREAGQITNETVISEKQLQRFYAEKARILQSIKTYLKENSKLTKDTSVNAKDLKRQFEAAADAIENLGKGDTVGLNTINKQVTTLKSRVRELGLEGRSTGDEIANMFSKFSGWFSVSQMVMLVISKIKEAGVEIKELTTTLTEISKTSDLSGAALEALGDRAFKTASKYGKSANDYLLGVQEMSRAGYENMEQMAELSTLVQSAGDLTAELANDYIIAADAAYDYEGNVQKLTALLDAQNQVTNRNAVSMEELANATKTAGSLLANVTNLSEKEMTAILGAGIASSRESGETVARAVRSIMMNLQGVAGEGGFDGEIIDEDALAKVEARCHSLGVELEYVQDGAVKLRDPMEILKDLADVYNRLDETDPARAALISDIGGKYRANILANLLEQWDKVEKIMADYEGASGSMAREAEKSANNLEGSLNRLSNTWTDTVENIADSDLLTNAVNMLNDVLGAVNNLTDELGTLGTVGLAAGTYFGSKNVGRHKMFCLMNMPTVICVL